MIYITEEEFLDIKSNHINMDLLETKGLANNGVLNDKYYLLQSKLYYYLNQILDKKLGLNSIEGLFRDSKLPPVSNDEKDIYQHLSPNQYFYLRNNFYIENLMVEEINTILNYNELDQNLENFILTNLRKLFVPSTINYDNLVTNFGPNNIEYSAPIDSIVLGLRFSEEEPIGLTEDEIFDKYCDNREKIETFKEKAIEVFKNKMNYDVKVIEYFSNDIKKNENITFSR